MNIYNCAFCFRPMTWKQFNDLVIVYYCSTCMIKSKFDNHFPKTNSPKVKSKYKFSLRNNKIILYSIEIEDDLLFGISAGNRDETNIINEKLYKIDKYFPLDINNSINSAKEIIKKVKLLSTFQ
jgi:hypothetical protein